MLFGVCGVISIALRRDSLVAASRVAEVPGASSGSDGLNLRESFGAAGTAFGPDAVFLQIDSARRRDPGLARLLQNGLAPDTLAIGAAFFFNLMTNYVAVLLLPALLTSVDMGFAQPIASRGLAMWNYGGVAAAVAGAFVIQLVGSRAAMLVMAVAAVAFGVVLALWPVSVADAGRSLFLILLLGAFVNGVQTTMYALAAHIYPTDIRSTGVGTAVAVGRIGNVVAAYVGSTAIDRGGSSGYFALMAALMLLVFASLALIKRHVPSAV